MRKYLRHCGLIAVLGTVALCAGCSVRGGGWLQSLFTGGKVTFALNGTFDPDTGVTTGRGELHDHSLNVDAHLTGSPFNLTEEQAGNFLLLTIQCLEFFGVEGGDPTFLFGEYTPQPKKLGAGGEFAAFVVDGGQGGSGLGDFIVIAFFDGTYDGYFDCGFLQGGNLKVTLP